MHPLLESTHMIIPKRRRKSLMHPSLFEYYQQQSMSDSCLVNDEVIYEGSETLPFEKQNSKKQPSTFRRLSSGGFIPLMPIEYQPYIVECKNVESDGHCGFRVVAALLGFGEDCWARVRQDLMNELNHNTHLYKGAFRVEDSVDEILESLNCFTEFAPFKNWFMLPYMGYLVASTYNVAFITLSTQISLTFLPLRSVVPQCPRSICLGMVNQNHSIQVLLGVGRRMPPIVTSWFDYHLGIADGWLQAYNTGQIS